MTNTQPKNPYDCVAAVVHKLRPHEVQLCLATIEYYGLLKKKEALEEHAAGTWIEQAAAERGVTRAGLVLAEGLRQLWGWLDKVTPADTKKAAGLTVAEEAINHFGIPLLMFLAHFISEADETTIATALELGRGLRDNQRGERRPDLRIVTSSSES